MALLALCASAVPARAALECSTSLGTYYPYCVNVPDNASGKLPAIMFLSGSGARGDASRVKELSGYDGVGKLINQYYSGNKGEAQTMAAEQFITIIPISPKNVGGQEIRHWMPENVQKVLKDVLSKHGEHIDPHGIHLGGYSMGARGCFRNGVANPETWASIAPSAGGAEAAGDGTLSQQKADSVFDKLSNMASVPVWQFAGEWDSTAGTDSPKRTQDALAKAGDGNAKLSILKADHSALSTQPFNAELLKWFLSNSGKGSGSGSSSSSDKGSSSDIDVSSADHESTSTSSSDKSDSSSKTASESTKASTGTKTNPKSSSRCKSSSGKKARKLKLRAKRSSGITHRSLSLTAMLAGRQQQAGAGSVNVKRSFVPGPASAPAAPGTGAILAARDVLAPKPMQGETVMQRRDPALIAREALRQTAGSRVGAARRR